MSARIPGPWTARGGGHNCQPRERNRADMLDWSSGIDCVAPFRDNEVSGYDTQTQTLARAHGRTLAEAEANAAFIVKACNAHDALVHALALVIESYEAGDGAMATKQVIDHVRSILATQRVTP